MTNLEWLIKQRKPQNILLNTINRLMMAVTSEDYSDAEEQAMAVEWLFEERKDEKSVQLREDQTDVETRHDDPMS